MRTTPELDTLQDKPEVHVKWTNIEEMQKSFPYKHGRDLPRTTAKKAITYIETLTRPYPFQMRYAMALPLWYRFCDAWCDTGDEQYALGKI